MATSPNLVDSQETSERREGLIVDQGQPLALNLSDEQVASIIGNRVSEAEQWWNSELKLDEARKKSERYYLNESYSEDDLYEFQVPYKNNRILTAVETLVPMITAQPAEPVVTEAQDTDESRQLAYDLGDVLLAQYEDMYLKAKLSMVARHLMVGKRVAVLKYRFDPSIGRLNADGSRRGKTVVEVVRPEKIVFERESADPDNISLIAEYLTATVEGLVFSFPAKKEEIYKHFGITRGVKSQLQKIVGYMEVWFSYYEEDGTKKEAVAWKLGNVVLDKIKNPNWNYDEYEVDETTGKLVNLNFLDKPSKPYILFNHLNLGKWIIDDTSLTEQALPLQDVLNKRGRQIVENADQAASGLVINSNMMSQDDAAKLIGDPTEKIMVGGDVRQAAARLPVNQLQGFVIQDKYDARGEIDNIFGSNAPIRGESSGIETLGQEILSQRANLGRLQSITDSIEDGMDKLYKAMVQMMKVYWDEPEIVRFQSSEGKTRFIDWSRDKVEDGIQVRVKAGSTLPKDKFALRNETIQTMAILDPLSIAEGLDKPHPKEFAKRIVYYRFFMDKYLTEILGGGEEGVDPTALADIQALLAGQVPEPPESPSKEYLATLEKFITSNGFKSIADPQVKQLVLDFVVKVKENAKAGIGEEEGGLPEAAPEAAGQTAVTVGEAPPAEPEGVAGNFLQRGVQGLMSRLRGGA